MCDVCDVGVWVCECLYTCVHVCIRVCVFVYVCVRETKSVYVCVCCVYSTINHQHAHPHTLQQRQTQTNTNKSPTRCPRHTVPQCIGKGGGVVNQILHLIEERTRQYGANKHCDVLRVVGGRRVCERRGEVGVCMCMGTGVQCAS